MKRQIKHRNGAVVEPGCSWGCWQGQGVQAAPGGGSRGMFPGGRQGWWALCSLGCSRKEQSEPRWMEGVRSPPLLLRGQPDRHSPLRHHLCPGLWHQFPLFTQTGGLFVLFSPSSPHSHIQEASPDFNHVQSKGCSSCILHFQLGKMINPLIFSSLYPAHPGQHTGALLLLFEFFPSPPC